jgi:hypothetical protein
MGGGERRLRTFLSEGLAGVSRQDVDLLGARFPSEDSVAALVIAKTRSFKQADTGHIAALRDAKHLPCCCDPEEDLESLAYCRGSDAAPLGGRRKSEADFAGEPIG